MLVLHLALLVVHTVGGGSGGRRLAQPALQGGPRQLQGGDGVLGSAIGQALGSRGALRLGALGGLGALAGRRPHDASGRSQGVLVQVGMEAGGLASCQAGRPRFA